MGPGQSKPVEPARVPGAREKGGRMLRGTVGSSQEAQVGGGSSRPPLEQGWKPDPGCVLPEAAYFGREACWQSAWCVELLTPGNRTALIRSQPCLASACSKICPSTSRAASPAPESPTERGGHSSRKSPHCPGPPLTLTPEGLPGTHQTGRTELLTALTHPVRYKLKP